MKGVETNANQEDLATKLDLLLPEQTKESISNFTISCEDASEAYNLLNRSNEQLQSEKMTKDDTPEDYENVLLQLEKFVTAASNIKKMLNDPTIVELLSKYPDKS